MVVLPAHRPGFPPRLALSVLAGKCIPGLARGLLVARLTDIQLPFQSCARTLSMLRVQILARSDIVQTSLYLVDKIFIFEDKRVEIAFRYRDEFARAMEVAKNYKDRPLPEAV